MILEGLVTTLGPDDALNIAPMGPEVGGLDLARFTLRPFRTSTTYQNLKRSGEGVLHVSDDVLMIARAAIGMEVAADTRPAEVVRGRILLSAARYHEFRVVELDDSAERTTIRVESVASGRLGDLFGLNRGKHAVIEAAILATRLMLIPRETILADFERLAVLVQKTGGPDERAAFTLLSEHVRTAPESGGSPTR